VIYLTDSDLASGYNVSTLAVRPFC